MDQVHMRILAAHKMVGDHIEEEVGEGVVVEAGEEVEVAVEEEEVVVVVVVVVVIEQEDEARMVSTRDLFFKPELSLNSPWT